VANDDGKTPEAHLAMKARMVDGPRYAITSLQVMVKAIERGLWPTPTATLGTKGGRVTPRKGREGGTLIEAVSARLWPTPTARDWKSSSMGTQGNARPLSEHLPGPLNPTWVEWLMGFPLGWTDCGDSATRSSRKSLKS
jgi:hypothetical protein